MIVRNMLDRYARAVVEEKQKWGHHE